MTRFELVTKLEAQAIRLHNAVEVVPWTEKHKVYDLRDQANALAHTLMLKATPQEVAMEAEEFSKTLDEILGFIDRNEF